MRFQLWGLLAHDSGGDTFEKIAEALSLAALLPSFRAALINGLARRVYLIDTTNQTVTVLV